MVYFSGVRTPKLAWEIGHATGVCVSICTYCVTVDDTEGIFCPVNFQKSSGTSVGLAPADLIVDEERPRENYEVYVCARDVIHDVYVVRSHY